MYILTQQHIEKYILFFVKKKKKTNPKNNPEVAVDFWILIGQNSITAGW